MATIFSKILKSSPSLKKWIWKKVYQFLAKKYQTKDWTFMNYGFQDFDTSKDPVLKPEDQHDKYFIQLYHQVVSSVDLKGLKVLEIGSGRGGGSDYIMRYFDPASMTGVDFSNNAIQFCKNQYNTPHLDFVQGNAENLPFEANSFDVVVNVESSHCYANMDNFLKEVHRVLKPGGKFLFSDFRDLEFIAGLNTSFEKSGLETIEKANISKEVLHALDEFNEEKMKRFAHIFGSKFKSQLNEFAGMKGSAMHTDLGNGNTIYQRIIALKS